MHLPFDTPQPQKAETPPEHHPAPAEEKGAILEAPPKPAAPAPELRQQALAALQLQDPGEKAAACAALYAAWQAAIENCHLPLNATATLEEPAGLPGRPEAPALVPPKQVPQRSPASREGRAALLHAICHIEFNAMNLALDAIWRFPHLPAAFYADWLQVAAEEATHFHLLRSHLRSLGHDYGDFPAHDGLWTMAQRTRHCALARMALVPRTLEARGLDATPGVQQRLRQVGDEAAVAILDIILRDEIGHVAIGNRWFAWLCQQRGQEPRATFRQLAREHQAPRMKGALNLPARRAAGFTEEELADLQAAAGEHL